MNHDFETLVSRARMGSSKWTLMQGKNAHLPEDIIPFSVADMEFKNAPALIEGLKTYLDEMIYGYSDATDAYYEAVQGWMRRRHGWEIAWEWIVHYPGVVPALIHLVPLLTQQDDAVLLMTPVYFPFYRAVKLAGRGLYENELVLRGDRYEIDFDDFEAKAKRPETTLFILCSPHNPVGRVWTKEELTRIGRICADNGVFVLSDEIHFDLIMPGYSHTVFASLSEEFANNCVTCTAPSKTFNLAGMQTSNIIISNDALRTRIKQSRDDVGMNHLNIVGYKACELSYNLCEDWLDELLAVLERNRRLVVDFVNAQMSAIKPIRLEGTYLQWLDCRGLGMEPLALERFMEDAMLYLDEGYLFGEGGKGFERVNLACPTHLVQAAMERLLAAYNKLSL